ncbi:MAG: MurR/RpiR family transcriptional regulator [Lachnospiraceae bacterium]|nr:MurR/RpiR family transcriptional regulator [Lachnospiraceae bacterium]
MDIRDYIDKNLNSEIETDEYISRISSQYSFLPKQQKKLARYILSHQDEVIHSSITTLSRKTNIAASTITRFCQSLSYSGFSEMKFHMSQRKLPKNEDTLITKNDSLDMVVQKLLKTGTMCFSETLRMIDFKQLKEIVHVLQNARMIHIYGQSSSYISSLYGQQMLMLAGILSQAYNDIVDMKVAAHRLTPQDVVVGSAYSGEAKSINAPLLIAKKAGATIIAITSAPDSTLAKLADYVLYYNHDIPDDLHYMFLPNICEITIWGIIQSALFLADPAGFNPSKKAILSNRM